MKAYQLSAIAASHIIRHLPYGARYLLLRPNSLKWSETDVTELLGNPAGKATLYVWKHTRILRAKDGALGEMADRIRKGQEPKWTAFGKWPELQQYETTWEGTSLVSDRSYASGCIDLAALEAANRCADIASLMSAIGESGLVAVSAGHSSSGPAASQGSIERLFDVLIAAKSKKYSSQEEWDRDLEPKEQVLAEVITKLLNADLIPMIPLENVDGTVALLSVIPRNSEESIAKWIETAPPLAEGEESQWEAGIFH